MRQSGSVADRVTGVTAAPAVEAVDDVADLDAAGVLDAAGRARALVTRVETSMLRLAVHFADLHPAESISPVTGRDGRVLPGLEQAVRLGGAGTPRVAEFCVAELGARLQLGPVAARHYLADALDVRHRLPGCWSRVLAGTARVPLVRAVAAETRHLDRAAAARVDAAMAPFVDGSLPRARFTARLEGQVVAADPEAAAAAEAEAQQRQYARRSRGSEHGISGFYLRGPVGLIARLEATVAYLADALATLGDPDPADLRRVKACAVLANPTAAVELLAALAAHRTDPTLFDQTTTPDPDPTDTSDTSDTGDAGSDDSGESTPGTDSEGSAGGTGNPDSTGAAGGEDGAEGTDGADEGHARGEVDRPDEAEHAADRDDTAGPTGEEGLADRHDNISAEGDEDGAAGAGHTGEDAEDDQPPPDADDADADPPPARAADPAPEPPPDETDPPPPEDDPPVVPVRPGCGCGGRDDSPLARVNAFTRTVAFDPTRLPTWLTTSTNPDQPVGRRRWTFDWSRLLPRLRLYLHLDGAALARDENGVARLEGEGPVTTRFVHDHLRPMHAYTITPVIDLAGQAPADAYEIPDSHRRAVALRTPADCFPYATALHGQARLDLDHTIPWQPGPTNTPDASTPDTLGSGAGNPGSSPDNYGPLSRYPHRIKTHGRWQVRQPFPGIYLWQDPHGQTYLVDATGTHPLPPRSR